MRIEHVFVGLLRGDPSVVSMVGDRIWRNVATTSNPETPFIVYRKIRGGHIQTSEGPIEDENSRYQVNCAGASPVEAQALADAVEAALDGLDNPDCALVEDTDDYEDGPGADESGPIHVIRQVYSVWSS